MNYTEKLHKYLRNSTELNETNSQITKQKDQKSVTKYEHMLDIVNHEHTSDPFCESLGIKAANYKRLVENCMTHNQIETNKCYNLKSFLPSRTFESKLIKKYEHLLPADRDINFTIETNTNDSGKKRSVPPSSTKSNKKSIENFEDDEVLAMGFDEENSNFPMKLEELENKFQLEIIQNQKQIQKKNKNVNINQQLNTKSPKPNKNISPQLFPIYFEKLEENNEKSEFEDDFESEEEDEIIKLNKQLRTNNTKINSLDDKQWHCLNFQQNFENCENLISKFLAFEI